MARPSSFTPELSREILRLVRSGHFTTTICNRVGIGRTTLWNWVHQGELNPEHEPYGTFAKQFREAESRAVIRQLTKLRAYGAGKFGKDADWKSVAWFMERRWPKMFAGRSEENRERDEPIGSDNDSAVGGEPPWKRSPWDFMKEQKK
jgi:predicted DNA-binding transcriptional regulator AlpA